MKKGLIILFAMLCATWTFAQNYGILVNGKTYYQASYEGPDPYGGGYEQYLSHVQVKSGDYCQLYDAENKAAWAVDLDGASSEGFTRNNDRYNITATGCYDFYIKLKWEADALYVGKGSNCGSGVDVDKIDTGGGGGGGDGTQYSTAAPAKCADVMLQAFYWDSYEDKGYGRTKWMDWNNGANNTSAEEIGKWFDLVWLPPMSRSSGGTGYHPLIYSSLDSQWGSKTTLQTLISTLHQNGARVVADIVINHAANKSGWCDFNTYNFGSYGTFTPDASWICNTDEVNYDSSAGSCKGKATGAADDGYGDEANYGAARDWDHNSAKVRDMFKAYLKWLRNDVGVDGFRYDYCKGFHNSHINDYNKAAGAYFSVMEYWDGNVNTLQDRLNDAGWNTLTFDFATKYTAFNDGIAANNYWKLKGAGLPGAGKARYACTFLDSHDSFQRDDNEFCGKNNSMKYPGKIQQCYAYLLSMPGIPCVFYPHWVKFKDQIKAMINARYKAGVHSESAVSDEAGDGFYKATITGTNGEIRVLIGPNSGYGSTPSGFTKAVTGENYGVYYKMNSNRGDKDQNRKPQGIEDVTVNTEKPLGEKFMRDGRLYIRCGEQVFDMMGNRIK
ncbi:MAG: hypothetical protein J6T80_06435 [Paludibacteraceae bacterium]|nr:hypothetical protein [Paludibacteraceae bacterium]